MLNDPLMHYQLITAELRERWQEAELSRRARATATNSPGRAEWVEAASDLTGLVERVLQHVWKRLGLPAREADFRSDARWSDFPSGKIHPAHPQDASL